SDITVFSMIRLSICAVFVVTLALALAATPQMYRYRPGEPTLADVPDFNWTADAEFVREAINDGLHFMIKLAHLGSMRSRKQRLQIYHAIKSCVLRLPLGRGNKKPEKKNSSH
ncbi:unnamed protein product, partial [Orchesella dallaii]